MIAEGGNPSLIRVVWKMLLPLVIAALAGCSSPWAARNAAAVGAADDRNFADLRWWAIEQMPGGSVRVHGRALEIEDQAGCTVWWREELSAPVAISFTATMLAGEGPNDRVSDLNCFWQARDSRSSSAPFANGNARSGKFADYDSLLTYYAGYGGNNNTTTRFRRYDGTPARPLLPEHDLSAPRFLLEPHHPYRIRLVARAGVAEYWRDGELIFSFVDPAPLQSGWFALRTVRSHLLIEDFRVERLSTR